MAVPNAGKRLCSLVIHKTAVDLLLQLVCDLAVLVIGEPRHLNNILEVKAYSCSVVLTCGTSCRPLGNFGTYCSKGFPRSP